MLSEEQIEVVCNPNQTKNCAIRLGSVYCDGYNPKGKIGCFSHFHQDHTHAITDCLRGYSTIITHPITFEAITAMDSGYRYLEQWVPQDYDTKYPSPVGDIRLLKANHIPGSAQVHVDANGLLQALYIVFGLSVFSSIVSLLILLPSIMIHIHIGYTLDTNE